MDTKKNSVLGSIVWNIFYCMLISGITLICVWSYDLPVFKNRRFIASCLSSERYHISPLYNNSCLLVRVDAYGDGNFGTKRAGNRAHRGVDFKADIGTGVVATKSGIVEKSTLQPKGMGNYVVIKHFDDTKTLYGHMADKFVKEGDLVKQGQIIGSIGKTGNASARSMITHLHYELWVNDVPVDPVTNMCKKGN